METTPFKLTPEQQGLLQSLSQETGKPISALIEEALAGLCEDTRLAQGEVNGGDDQDAPQSAVQAHTTEAYKPIWEIFATTDDIPDEEWEKLPTDLATQHDHYIYGTPKRQV